MAGRSPYEPLARWGHTSVAIGDKVYVWGGRTDDFSEAAKKVLSSTVEIFDISTERWEKKKTKGKPPFGLYNNAFTLLGKDLFVFGGWDGQATHNSLHKFNMQTLTWVEMKSNENGEVPMSMSGCGLVAKGSDELVLFGGYGLPSGPGTPKKKDNNIHLKTTAVLSLGSSLNDSVKMRKLKNTRVVVGGWRGKSRGGIGGGKGGGSGRSDGGGGGGRKVSKGDGRASSSKEGEIEEKGSGESKDKDGGRKVSKGDGRASSSSSKEGEIEEKERGESKDEGGGGRKEIEEAKTSKGGENQETRALPDKVIDESVRNGNVSANSGVQLISGELLGSIKKPTNALELTSDDKLGDLIFTNRNEFLSPVSLLHNQDLTGVEVKSNVQPLLGVTDKSNDAGSDMTSEEKMVNGVEVSEKEKVDLTLATVDEVLSVMENGEKEVDLTLASVGEVLSVMTNEEEEKKTEGKTVINKRWTNELKVYNINTGLWSSPEMEGECPPPCVDFSFNSIDNGRRAVMFGGYRPESGASSGAYVLDMETWFWTELGNLESSNGGKMLWPVGRDGHASCVISDVPHPHILVFGGWDQDNRLINDAWILDIECITWKKLVVPELLGPRLWHRVVCIKSSSSIWDLLFFGGCPVIPVDVSEARGQSWSKLASTVLLELGLVKSTSSSVNNKQSSNAAARSEWVVLDALGMEQMGMGTQRTKEAILFAKYRAIQAEVRAKKAERLANETLKKINEVLSRLQGSPCSLTASTLSLNQVKYGGDVPEIGKAPSWVVPRSQVQLTLEEVGRGRWAVIQVADYKGTQVAARCIYSQVVSQNNRKLFQDNLHMMAKIRHPNILTFIGAVMEGDPIILTELMPTNLRRVMDVGMLENYQISGIGMDIANALFFLHSIKPEPIIHGDFTSTSILLQKCYGEFWKAKISDFVTAKFFQKIISTEMDLDHDFSEVSKFLPSQVTSPHPQKSSEALPSFRLVPKMINQPMKRRTSTTVPDMQNISILTTQRDVYSFGLLLVEMCTGTPPLDVSLKFLMESITWSSMVSALKACTEYNPDLRPSMESVLKQLKSIHEETLITPSKYSLIQNVV